MERSTASGRLDVEEELLDDYEESPAIAMLG
jgi:hypothetical protein